MVSFGNRGNSRAFEFLRITSHIGFEYSTLSRSILCSYSEFNLEQRNPESAPVPNPKFKMRTFSKNPLNNGSHISLYRLGHKIGTSQLWSDAHPNAIAMVAIARMYSKPTTLRSMRAIFVALFFPSRSSSSSLSLQFESYNNPCSTLSMYAQSHGP